MSDIIDMTKKFKSDAQTQAFIEAQTNTILALNQRIKEQESEIVSLKAAMVSSPDSLIGDSPVSRIIVTPEEALIEEQISIIHQRSYLKELSLEDVKKLDILMKNKKLIKDDKKDIQGQSKKLSISNDELLKLADKSHGA